MIKISFVTFARNYAKELEVSLRHVHDIVDEIVVVNGMNTDNTREVATNYNAKIFVRKPWDYANPDRMFALKVCSYDWVLYLDVNERLNSRLKH